MKTWKPDIFSHTDFRAYLKAYYEAAKANQPHFSYRYFSRRAGFASSNFLKLVIDGKRNVSPASVEKIGGALGLDGEEQRFFALLVDFAQTEDPEARGKHLEEIAATRRFRKARPLDGLLYDYLSRWYHVPIREMVAHTGFREDPDWIAARLKPTISADQAAEALRLLEQLGLLVRTPEGELDRGEPTLDGGGEIAVVGVRQFHRLMIGLAADSIDHTPAPQRDISAVTVSVRSEDLPELKRRLREFGQQLAAFCDGREEPDVVYQINMQLFPMTRSEEEEP